MRFSCRSLEAAEEEGDGSKSLRLLTIHLIGSTGIQRASGREKTSVQNTGGVLVGSGVATRMDMIMVVKAEK
jgi:hypothetical protein